MVSRDKLHVDTAWRIIREIEKKNNQSSLIGFHFPSRGSTQNLSWREGHWSRHNAKKPAFLTLDDYCFHTKVENRVTDRSSGFVESRATKSDIKLDSDETIVPRE